MDAGAPSRIAPAAVAEDGPFTRAVDGAPVVGFGAFLDGVQESRAAAWVAQVPFVVASIGAVVLERRDGVLTSWPGGVRRRSVLLLPRDLVDPAAWEALSAAHDVEDSRAEAGTHHPDALLQRAVHAVEELRAAQERSLAEAWVAQRSEPLYVDGGLASMGVASRSPLAIGVVKSHRTIHAAAERVAELFALGEGQRTCVHAIEASAHRPAVWTWYLRLRTASATDPLFGLARVEIAVRSGPPTPVADEVSRWVLAERTPVAMPDARWDVLSYGIARCEAYLKRGLNLGGEGRS